MYKKILVFLATLAFPFLALAFSNDLAINQNTIRFSPEVFLERKTIRIYATIQSNSAHDLRGVVKFFDSGTQISADQPVSVLANREDSVFVDWTPPHGQRTITTRLIPFEASDDNPANNEVSRTVEVRGDFDHDGIANADDPDDDNDGALDQDDAFPHNKNETVDSDGDTKGNNQDYDDDNDGVKDADDALPFNANETIDTDGDGIGNNEDKFPLDSTQSRDLDNDGISDERDSDADNDHIAKKNDINDLNLGPVVIVTKDGKYLQNIGFPNEALLFETSTSFDPDGIVTLTEWDIEGKKQIAQQIQQKFPKTGVYPIKVTVTDDKGESREKIIKVLIIPPSLPLVALATLLLLTLLAIYKLFSYSKHRRRKW